MISKRLQSHNVLRGQSVSILLFWVFVTVGCNERVAVPSTVPVKGLVKYKGKPIGGVRVTLHRQDGSRPMDFVPMGDTGPDGSFKLSTGAPQNGAPPGAYIVTFERPLLDPKQSVETEIDGFRGKFSDPAQSKWTVKIERGDNSLQPFELD